MQKISISLEKLLSYLGIKNEKNWTPFLLKWFSFGLFIHCVFAICSTGFHHFDEHFQILEFLNAKLDKTPIKELPWEYHHKMRSWTQPGLYYLMAKFWSILSLENPFFWVSSFRLLTSLIGQISICTLSLAVFFLFKEDIKRKWAIILLNLTWYVPYIQTRPSSEGLGSNLFILGISMMIWGLMRQKSQNKFPFYLALTSGIFFGLSFTFRFQLGFVVMFCWFWMVFIQKIHISRAIGMAGGIISMIFLEVLVDYWGYGEWTVTPWNYVHDNLVLLDKGREHLQPFMSPWWSYFKFSLMRGVPPLSLILIFSQLLFWFKRPLHLLTWATLPLLVIHSIISIKSMRYLFPIAILTPLTLIELPALLKLNLDFFKKKWVKATLKSMLVLNCILLMFLVFKPAEKMVDLYHYIYKNKINEIYIKGENPYSFVGLPVYYYKAKELNLIFKRPDKKKKEFWYFVGEINSQNKIDMLEMNNKTLTIDSFNCQPKYLKYPLSLLKFNIGNWQKNSTIWGLFRCQHP